MPDDGLSQQIIGTCDQEIENFSNDCSGFLKSVAGKFGVLVVGNANSIYRNIISDASEPWRVIQSGRDAAYAAEHGEFVIAGLEASGNGHVAVIVKGPLAHGRYPYGYWGQYHGLKAADGGPVNVGFTRGHGGINYAWGPRTRDQVRYAAIKPSKLLTSSNAPSDASSRGRIQW
jgi:hypothetical protein